MKKLFAFPALCFVLLGNALAGLGFMRRKQTAGSRSASKPFNNNRAFGSRNEVCT
jgi:hypothetical protein